MALFEKVYSFINDNKKLFSLISISCLGVIVFLHFIGRIVDTPASSLGLIINFAVSGLCVAGLAVGLFQNKKLPGLLSFFLFLGYIVISQLVSGPLNPTFINNALYDTEEVFALLLGIVFGGYIVFFILQTFFKKTINNGYGINAILFTATCVLMFIYVIIAIICYANFNASWYNYITIILMLGCLPLFPIYDANLDF